MRLRRLAALASLATLAACASNPSKPTGSTLATGNKPATCGVRMLGHSVRPGEDMLVVFTVKENAQWCFDAVGISGIGTEGQTVVQPPAHGQVRLVHQSGAIVFGYRPAPGFTGTDQFRIGVPSPIDTFYLSAHPTVTP